MAARNKPSPSPDPKPPAPPKPTGSAKARRSAARLAAVQALYQVELAETPVDTVVGEFVRHRFGHEIDGETFVTADPTLFADIVRGVVERRGELDELLAGCLDRQWTLDRMEAILRATLRAGAWEMLANSAVAAHIVINDYIDVTHGFFSGREPGMVNGVLDRLGRTLRAGEMPRRDERA